MNIDLIDFFFHYSIFSQYQHWHFIAANYSCECDNKMFTDLKQNALRQTWRSLSPGFAGNRDEHTLFYFNRVIAVSIVLNYPPGRDGLADLTTINVDAIYDLLSFTRVTRCAEKLKSRLQHIVIIKLPFPRDRFSAK